MPVLEHLGISITHHSLTASWASGIFRQGCQAQGSSGCNNSVRCGAYIPWRGRGRWGKEGRVCKVLREPVVSQGLWGGSKEGPRGRWASQCVLAAPK